MAIQKLPHLGDGVQEVTIGRWLKKVGEPVKANAPLLEVETDKISLEVSAESDGALLAILAPEGSKLRVGDPLAELGDADARATGRQGDGVTANTQSSIHNTETDNGRRMTDGTPPAAPHAGRVSPVVSRMVAEHGLTLSDIPATGEGGRVTKQDVLAFLKTEDGRRPDDLGDRGDKDDRGDRSDLDGLDDKAIPNTQYPIPTPSPQPLAPNSQSPAPNIQPLSPMRARIAEHMARSVQTSPHVTTIFEFDFGAAAKHREAHKASFARDGVNLTYLAYLVAATAQALRQHRMANSSWSEAGIALHREVNIGIAVAIPPDGLLVPVIRNADELSLMGIARKIQDVAARARAKHIKPDETQGGTFSITNHGVGGSLAGTPIINQPQAGILGFGALEKRVKVVDDMIAIRPCAYVSFSFDHRILDGAAADAFVTAIKQRIENWAD